MTDHEIIKIMGWANGKHDARQMRRARDLVEAAQKEREAEIRASALVDGREAFEREMIRLGYDVTSVQHDEFGPRTYIFPAVAQAWRGWELMRTRVAIQKNFWPTV